MKPKKSSTKESSAEATRSGAEILIEAIEREGVETVFAYPGGQSLPIHQALSHSKKLRVILPRHEQGGAFEADAYARASGKPGVCMATSGPGATNLLTGIADAWMDSIPVIFITGQVAREMIGRSGFQETDIFGMTLPIIKHSYLVLDVKDVPRIVREAFHVATSGRPGPVLIDMPRDIQNALDIPVFPKVVEMQGYKPEKKADISDIEALLAKIATAKKPVIYAGGGIVSADASAALLEFAERTQIPVTTTLMGLGAFPQSHALSLEWLGMHGALYANNATNEADLLIAVGARFDDRVTGAVAHFCPHGDIVHIDIDNSEFHKNKAVSLPILSDARYALEMANSMLAAQKCKRVSKNFTRFPAWYKEIADWKKKYPFTYKAKDKAIHPQYVIELLCKLTDPDNTIITTGVGQHQMWTAQYYRFNKPRTFISSLGLGSMGFGYPAAVGAKLACPEKEVIDIDGDGSFLMNIQELATACVERIAAKAIIINNQYLGMPMQWEDRFFGGNRGNTFLGDPQDLKRIYPDFPAICEGFGVPCRRVTRLEDLESAIRWLLEQKEAAVLDILTPSNEHVMPMIPAGKSYKEVILE